MACISAARGGGWDEKGNSIEIRAMKGKDNTREGE
jgi:hypothetical protein